MRRIAKPWQRVALAMLVLAALQVVAWWVYQRVEGDRAKSDPEALPYESLGGEARGLDAPLVTADGSAFTLRQRNGAAALVHFWATWCAPCRSELPKLLQLSRDGTAGVVLVSVDENWPVVSHFFDGEIPAEVVRDASGAARSAFSVSTLPDTYLLDARGRPIARFYGARDWSASNVRSELTELLSALARTPE